MTMTAPPGLDAAQQSKLERLIIRARMLLETDFAAQTEGRFGIHLDGTIEDQAALPDSPTDKITRSDLEQIVTHLRTLGEDPAGAVARLLREAAFTHVNRLIAIRVAEAIGFLPESLARGTQSRGFRDLGEIMPMLSADYRGYLRLCGDELAADAPVLFDPRNPLLALEPSTAAFDELVALLADPGTAEIWAASDTLGWSYQFFNTGDERRQMREAAAPRNSRELAVRNQFFTPRYVVDFLVQNTLGRRLIENDPASLLLDDLPLLVDPPKAQGTVLQLDQVKCLDPACGSGHFLLGCYDLLERAWELAGVASSESAPMIVDALWGVDIDARCAQVASAAIVLRARRHCRDLPLPRPNIVTARGLVGGSAFLPPELQLSAAERDLVDQVGQVLADAPLLGTLLKAETALEEQIRHSEFGGQVGTLPLNDSAAEATERQLLVHLQAIANQASSTVVERLLAAEADDALRFVEVTRQRYDIVLMNPPYGLSIPSAETYLKFAFPDGWTDLYAAFFYRAIELLENHGYLGALTSSQFFATRKQRALRQFMIQESRPLSIIDLGSGVLHGAAVNTAMTVMTKRRSTGRTFYIDLTTADPSERDTILVHSIAATTTRVDLSDFVKVDGCPFAFHASEHIDSWATEARLEPGLAIVRTGNRTFDDFRFVRCRWEVDPGEIGRSWIPYEKGGTYRPYFSPAHLVLDWRQDGESLRALGKEKGVLPQILQSSSHWYIPGLSFPRVNKGLGVRVMPSGEIFSEKSNVIFPNPEVDPLTLLGILNSSSVAALIQTFGRSRFIENGAVKALPVSTDQFNRLCGKLPSLVRDITEMFVKDDSLDETSAVFCSPFLDGWSKESFVVSASNRRRAATRLQNQIDSAVQDVLKLSIDATSNLESRSALVASALMDPLDAEKEWALRGLSYLFGLVIGRWDVRVAKRCEGWSDHLDFFEAMRPCSPGMLLGRQGLPAIEPPVDYPFDLPPNRLLVDEPGHRWDVEASIFRVASDVLDDSASMIAEMFGVVSRRTVRDYFRKQFFKDHLFRYSKSRRKAPIYWPLTVPSRNWGVWIYAPAFTRETLYAVAGEAGRRERLCGEAIARLQNELQQGGRGRSAGKVAEELDAEEKLAEELRLFRLEAERIAALGWEPNVNDSVILCAAPLADLFPAWPDTRTARAELRRGAYPWATVAAWADRL